MPRRGSPYGWAYQRQRRALLRTRPTCTLRLACGGAPADSADHDPPLALHTHVAGSGCCRLVAACLDCQHEQGRDVAAALRSGRVRSVPPASRAW